MRRLALPTDLADSTTRAIASSSVDVPAVSASHSPHWLSLSPRAAWYLATPLRKPRPRSRCRSECSQRSRCICAARAAAINPRPRSGASRHRPSRAHLGPWSAHHAAETYRLRARRHAAPRSSSPVRHAPDSYCAQRGRPTQARTLPTDTRRCRRTRPQRPLVRCPARAAAAMRLGRRFMGVMVADVEPMRGPMRAHGRVNLARFFNHILSTKSSWSGSTMSGSHGQRPLP